MKVFGFLPSLPRASERLKMFGDPENFGAYITCCVRVFHVATTRDLENKEAEEIVTERSIDGPLGILTACLDSKIVKKFLKS